MSISVNGAGRVAPTMVDTLANPTGSTTASAAGTSSSTSASIVVSETPIDPVTQQPKPLRFPWLSRLSSELDPVAKQKPPFTSAPVLGDNLDQAA